MRKHAIIPTLFEWGIDGGQLLCQEKRSLGGSSKSAGDGTCRITPSAPGLRLEECGKSEEGI